MSLRSILKIRLFVAIFTTLSLFFVLSPLVLAAAGDETTAGSLALCPTIECIGVVSNYSGDNNQNNTAVLRYRELPSGTWRTAPAMYADRSRQQYRGSIFWLTANTQYEVEVIFSDSDGGSSVSGTTITGNDNPLIGTNYYYVAKNGSDSTGDGASGNPWGTIQHAADNVSAGDTVLIRAGTYSELVTVTTSGTANNYITFMPYGTDTVIIDGGGTRYWCFDIDGANYIRIKGITMANTRGGSNIGGGVYLENSDYCIVEYCIFDNCAPGSYGGSGTGSANVRIDDGSTHTLVQNNTFQLNSTGAFGVSLTSAGDGNVIRRNTFSGTMWDGITNYPEDYANGLACNTDIYENTVSGSVGDDGISLDGDNVNCRIWSNEIYARGLVGISTCPVLRGPTYVFRNIIDGATYGFKLGDMRTGYYGRLYYFHNTVYNSGKGWMETDTTLGNVVTRNNIIYTGYYAAEWGSLNTSTYPCDMDYDILYSTFTGGNLLIKWANNTTYQHLTDFNTATGNEAHGIEQDPSFANPGSDNFTLQGDSPAIDAGVILPGFNDANSPWPYSEAAPDIGAYESGYSAPTNYPPVLSTIGNKTVDAEETLQFTVSAIDPNGDTLTYSATNLPSGATFNATTRTFSWTPTSSQVGSYPNVRFAVSDGSLTDYEYITITVTAGGQFSLPLRVNAGGSEYNDTQGNTWEPDQAYASGSWGFYGPDNTADRGTSYSISGTTDDRIYQTERYDLSGYLFDLENGTYDIVLHFAETYLTSAGQRVFDVSIEGQLVLDNLDVYSEVGYSAALTKSFNSIVVQDGQLNIEFTSSIEQSEINGIEILLSGGNHAPVLSLIGNKSVAEGELLQFTISATDSDGDSLTYSASNLPTGATFNATTRTFSWTPTSSQTGSYPNVRFMVSDGTLTDYEYITITVGQFYEDWDVNSDGYTNILDIILVGQHWNETGLAGWIRADVNKDGVINVLDIITIGQNWTG